MHIRCRAGKCMPISGCRARLRPAFPRKQLYVKLKRFAEGNAIQISQSDQGVVAMCLRLVHPRFSAEWRLVFVRTKRRGKLFTMNRVFAHGVAPGHVPPIPAVRIVLVKQVVFPFEVNQPVGIIQPAAARREMKLRPQPLVMRVLGAFDLVGLVNGTQAGRTFWHLVHLNRDGLTEEQGRIQKRPAIRFAVNRHHNIADDEIHTSLAKQVAAANQEIKLWLGDHKRPRSQSADPRYWCHRIFAV